MRIITTISLLLFMLMTSAQDYPLGYIKQFDASFNTIKFEKEFVASSTIKTKIANSQVHVHIDEDTLGRIIPNGILLLDNFVLGDFIANISIMMKTNDIDTLGGVFFLTGVRDSSNYYFIQLNKNGAHFYKMYKSSVSHIDSDSSFVLPEMTWLELHITRSILQRTIKIKCGDDSVDFYDPNLIMGYIGLGLTESKVSLKKFEVWGPTSIEKSSLLFRSPVEKTLP